MKQSQTKYKGIIFDLDQTLTNTEDFTLSSPLKQENCKKYAEWHVFQFLIPYLKIITWERFQEAYFSSRKEIGTELKDTAASHNRYLYLQRTLENLGLRFSPGLVYKATEVYWSHVLKNMELFPNVETVLKEMEDANLITAIVTDLTADIQIRKLDKLGIGKYVDYLVTSEEALAEKPNPKPILLLLKKMRLKPDEVILIGNNPKTDIQGAINTGLDCLLFDYYNVHKDFKGPKISDFSEVLNVLGLDKLHYSSDKLLIFDLFGTLADEPHLISVTFLSTLKDLGIDRKYSDVKPVYQRYKIGKISREEFWNAIEIPSEQINAIESRLIDNINIRPNAIKILKALRKKYKTAILSNAPSEWGRLTIKKLGLAHLFNAIVFSGDHGTKKPDPQLYQILLSNFHGIDPANIHYIDNELGDLAAAKNLLMKTVWLRIEEPDANYIPDLVIDDLEELRGALRV